MINRYVLCLAIGLTGIQGTALAKVSPEEAARLGKDLTPVGAEKAGNKDGTIPAWTGGITKAPAGFKTGDFHPDPYAADKVKFVIDKTNYKKYEKNLSKGHVALLQTHPTYFMNVYPTRRSASYPDFVYDALKKNAVNAEIFEYGTGVKNTIMSSPFPIPKNGAEVIWNHTLRYRGGKFKFTSSTINTTASGDKSVTTREYEYFFKYSQPGLGYWDLDNTIFFLKRKTLAPASLAGQMTLVQETLDQVRSPRKSWIYMPGQRRVRRTPDLAYDTADIDSNGIRTIDQVDIFNGAPDLYDWNLIGKQEVYVPYNDYKLHSGALKIDDIIGPYTITPELVRYEMHRVWVVEATLRIGMNHVYQKRRYYFDEDTWSILVAEEYSAKGELLELSESHLINFYDVQVPYTTLDVTYDFKDKRYYAEGLDNERNPPDFSADLDEGNFTASALRREATR